MRKRLEEKRGQEEMRKRQEEKRRQEETSVDTYI